MPETVFKRIISMILVVILLLSCIPVNTLAIDLNSRDTATWIDAFRGKTLSILGDSISTYKDHSNGAAAKDTNTTIQNGAIYYPRSGFDVTAESTWWYQAAEELGMEILVNNSWSGSCLLNTRSGTVGAYVDRCVQLHDNTGDDADRKPDIIAIFLGTNDYYTYPNTLGTYESIDFDGLITEGDNGFLYAEPTTSMEAYAISLHKIGQAYPDAEVYCFTLLPRVNSSNQPTAFNEDICQLAEKFGAYTVDLYDCGIQSESTAFYKMMGDNLHPDNPGMDAITNAFVSELLKNSELTTHDISFALEGAVSLEGTRRTVVSGESFEAVLAPLDASLPLEVTVTMGGADITAGCWENSVVTIPVVTADVVITAKPGQREPLNFRWETREDAFVSVTSDGNTANDLTMTHGSITDGVFSKTRFTMSQGISLRHDLPWCVEWKSSGTWTDTTDGALLFSEAASSSTADAYYFYRRHNNDFFAFGSCTGGKYHNYGVKFAGTGIDTTAEHVFRLENRIAADGSNMVWLLVDGEDVGPLNHHYIGGTDQKETVDWVSGKDFTFSYMGTNPHTIGGCSLEYVQVWENYHTHSYTPTVTAPTCTEQGYTTYTCQCGDNYVANYVEAKDHEFGEVTRIDNDSRRSVCNVCGVDKIYERLTLPAVNNGEVYVENNTEGLYYGSANIADLLGLKDGTYTEGDVTITIEGTKISAHGTPAKTLYFDLQKGTFGVPDYQRDPGYELPDGSYRFGLLGEGEVLPTACIRNKDGVGNILARAGMSNHNSLIGNNFGIPYLYLPAGKTYDFDGKLILTMGMDANADSDTPNTQVFSGNGILTEGDFLWSMDADIAVFGTIGSRDSGKIRYSNGSKEYINIYLPREVGYLQIQMDLVNKQSTNAYGWRLNMMYACDNNLKQLFPVTSTGEYEAAIRLIDRADFMGMGAHGSERMTSFAIYIDGVETSLDALTTMSNWQTIRIKRESDFYDPLDETTLVATHTVVYDFDLSGLTVTQDVDWLVDEVCTTSYMMMFPVRRAYDNLQVSNTYYDDYDSTWYDVSQTGFTTYPVKWTTGATKMTLFSDKSGVTATMESLETMQLTGSGYKHCANSGEYNKLYFTICGGGGSEHTVTAGDNWHTKHRYEVTITQGTDCFFGHNYVAAVTAPTCTEQGYTTYTCTECGYRYVSDYTDAIEPYSYRWEMDNNALVSISTNGNRTNALTLDSGSVVDGILNKARYTLQNEVRLYHNAPWTVEWCSTGNWSGMLLASVSQSPSDGLTYLFRDPGSKLFAFGEYTGTWNNYGLILDCDMTVPHIFRLENRIAPDGTNMVYLLVDGEEVGAMHHHYVGGTNKNATVDWANGKDIVLRNIGTSSHPMSGMQLEYLHIWENGHNHSFQSSVTAPTCTEKGYTTYTCQCGDSYVANYVDAAGHTYENGACTACGTAAPSPYAGKTIACIGDSITYGVGVTRDQTDYVTLLAKSLEMDYIRLGASGTTLCTDGHATCNIRKLTEANLAGADVVTILMGINDFVQAKNGYYSLGTIDSTDTSTIYGAVHMWCQRIEELRQTDSLKDTEFYFMTPVITSWNNSVSSARNWDQGKVNIHGYTLRDLCNAVIEVCAMYDIPVIDLNLLSGLYYNSPEDNSIAQFGGDGAHPGEIGHQMMANAIENVLLQNNLRDDHDHSYGSWITTTYPDCESGEQQRVCAVCAATERKMLDGKGHAYENGVCTGCGAEHPNLANYKGKVISIMGDSISTFEGYVPVADGYNREHLSRYPQDNLLTDVNETWWMQVVDQLDAKLGINESWRGSTLSGAVPVTTGDTGENAAMSNLIRIQNMGSNGTPDVILLYGGTNDLAHVSKVGTFDPLTAPTQADLVTKKWDNLADGFVHTLLRIRHFYPDATIVALLPTYTASYYSQEKLAQGNGVMAQICEHYGIPYVDLRDSGVTAGHLPDGIHPGEEGMDLITAAVLEVLLQQPIESGENQVWSVSHELTHVKASLGHYKGISQGKTFVENLTGENLTVTVTMGGVDITENVYVDGTIFIEEVTGALVIRAEGEQKAIYADYLQQLPENFCSSTNLWTLLVHDREYYTANGWGTHSSGKVRSVTIPITPGDRIWATSFQAAGANGSSVNGIRLTWFDTYGVLNSMSADKVYQEFLENGYVTAPEGAAAVNIVMWTDSDSNELYILNREHSYCDGYCAVCGIRQVSTFRILDTRCNRVETFTYEVGMTWKEWLNSKYNTGMGSCIAIWVSEGPDILGSNPYMDIYVNGDPVDYDALICETDDMELVRYN